MDAQNKILIIGSPHSQLADIIQKLAKVSTCNNVNVESFSISTTPFTIDTKYYTASVVIWNIETITTLNESIQEQLSENCEAIILIYDSNKPESFEYIKDWISFVEELSPSVSLCYGFGTPSSLEKERERWCIDHSIEHVLDSSKEEEDEDNAYPDKYGIDRVMEALEANMWPNMTFKTQQRPVKAAIVEGIEDEIEITKESDVVTITETVTTTTTVEVVEEPTKQKLSKTERRARAIQREQEEKAKQAEQELAKKKPAKVKKGKKSNMISTEELLSIKEELALEDEEMDKEMENFEKMFANFSSMRESAKNMSDSDRRDFAAKMILSLLEGSDEDDM